MHKVCDIRNPNLRAGLAPRDLWAAYAADLSRLMDTSGLGDPANAIALGGGRPGDGRDGPLRKAA